MVRGEMLDAYWTEGSRLDVQPTEQTETVTVPQIPFDKYISLYVYTACTYLQFSTYNSLQIPPVLSIFQRSKLATCPPFRFKR